LKAHTWFEKFDWDALLDKKLKPPYIPQNKDISKLENG